MDFTSSISWIQLTYLTKNSNIAISISTPHRHLNSHQATANVLPNQEWGEKINKKNADIKYQKD